MEPRPVRVIRADNTVTELAPLMLRPTEAGAVLRLSRSVVFELIRTGRLRSVKQGRTRLIPLSAVREYVALLESEAA